MTEKEIKKKCKSLDHSNETFKNIIGHCSNPKFTNLDRWQNFQAQSFKEENTFKNNSKFKIKKSFLKIIIKLAGCCSPINFFSFFII